MPEDNIEDNIEDKTYCPSCGAWPDTKTLYQGELCPCCGSEIDIENLDDIDDIPGFRH